MFQILKSVEPHTWEILREGADGAILAVGSMVLPALEAADVLDAEGVKCTVVNCRFLKPYDRAVFNQVMRSHPVVLTVEEGQVVNGFGAFMAKELNELGLSHQPQMSAMGLPDSFIEHGARKNLLADIGLDVEGIIARIQTLVGVRSPSLMETA